MNKKEYLLGKTAYDAYCSSKNINWKSFRNTDLPQFENQTNEIKDAWIESAIAVKKAIEEQDEKEYWEALDTRIKKRGQT